MLVVWHYSTKKNLNYAALESSDKVSHIETVNIQKDGPVEPRRFSIPDPSPSFDLAREEVAERIETAGAIPRTPSPELDASPSSEQGITKYVCIKPFTPKKKDDVAMMAGDSITISMTFTDGWAHGNNLTTGSIGMFPISCVALVDAVTPKSASSAADDFEFPPLAPEGQGRLLFSMVYGCCSHL
ncbi:hypothetical protein HDU91_006377 [Kappamyces sp. JEL0680]|nr:hypothetical protein HDU91_006377 [Kappamyces sp. JEL0680]